MSSSCEESGPEQTKTLEKGPKIMPNRYKDFSVQEGEIPQNRKFSHLGNQIKSITKWYDSTGGEWFHTRIQSGYGLQWKAIRCWVHQF